LAFFAPLVFAFFIVVLLVVAFFFLVFVLTLFPLLLLCLLRDELDLIQPLKRVGFSFSFLRLFWLLGVFRLFRLLFLFLLIFFIVVFITVVVGGMLLSEGLSRQVLRELGNHWICRHPSHKFLLDPLSRNIVLLLKLHQELNQC